MFISTQYMNVHDIDSVNLLTLFCILVISTVIQLATVLPDNTLPQDSFHEMRICKLCVQLIKTL